MRCRKVRSFLSAYCRGETSPKVAAEIKRHVDDCSACGREEAAYRSMNTALTGLSAFKTSDDFTTRLFQRIGHEAIAERKTKAYFPGRIPRFGTARLATVASVAVIVMALGIGLNLHDTFMTSPAPRMAAVPGPGGDDDYITAQPTDNPMMTNNPLLNEHKSVSRMIAQYNRWREFSRSLRTHPQTEQLWSGRQNVAFASSRSGSFDGVGSTINVRPVIKDYLIIPE